MKERPQLAGPHAEYIIEVYGTEGLLRWNLERMNQLELAQHRTIMTSQSYGEFGSIQPGHGTRIGLKDLQTIEADPFLRSRAEGKHRGFSAADGQSGPNGGASLGSAVSGDWVEILRFQESRPTGMIS